MAPKTKHSACDNSRVSPQVTSRPLPSDGKEIAEELPMGTMEFKPVAQTLIEEVIHKKPQGLRRCQACTLLTTPIRSLLLLLFSSQERPFMVNTGHSRLILKPWRRRCCWQKKLPLAQAVGNTESQRGCRGSLGTLGEGDPRVLLGVQLLPGPGWP